MLTQIRSINGMNLLEVRVSHNGLEESSLVCSMHQVPAKARELTEALHQRCGDTH